MAEDTTAPTEAQIKNAERMEKFLQKMEERRVRELQQIKEKLQLLETEIELTTDLEGRIKLNKEVQDLQLAVSKEKASYAQEEFKNLLKQKRLWDKRAKILADMEEKGEEERKRDEEKVANLEEMLGLEKDQLENAEEYSQQLMEQIKTALLVRNEAEKTLEAHKDTVDSLSHLNSKMTNAVARYTTITGQAETMAGHMFKTHLTTARFAETLDTAAQAINKQVTLANTMLSLIDSSVQATMILAAVQEQVLTNFNRATGVFGTYNNQIIALERNSATLRLTTEEAANSYGALHQGMTIFSRLGARAQGQIAKTTSALSKMGMDAKVQARNMDIATRSLNMTTAGAERLNRQLFSVSRELRIPPSAMAEGFAAAAPKLAQHGDRMVKVFIGLQEQAERTGVSVNSLLSIVGKFDTFEGAADAAGRLNAVLGGNLVNSVDLLMATEEERVKILQETLKISGKQWHEMNRFEKMAVANAAGISDMAEAAAIFNPTMFGMTEEQKKHAATQKELASLMPHVNSVMDDLRVIFMRLAVSIRPATEFVKNLTSSVIAFTEEYPTLSSMISRIVIVGGVLGSVAVGAIVVVAKLTLAIGAIGVAVAKIKASGGVLGAATAGITKWSSGAEGAANNMDKLGNQAAKANEPIAQSGKAAASSWKSMLAFGGAVLMVGAGIAMATYGVSALADSISNLSGEQMSGLLQVTGLVVGGMLLFAGGIAAVGMASGVAFAPMLAFGGAVLMVGTGIGIASVGVSFLVKAFAQLASSVGGTFDSMSGFFTTISSLSLGTLNILRGVSGEIASITKNISLLPEKKTIALTKAINATAAMTAMATTTPMSATPIDALYGSTNTTNVSNVNNSFNNRTGGVQERPVINANFTIKVDDSAIKNALQQFIDKRAVQILNDMGDGNISAFHVKVK
jgi:hypothetical protein